jgi:hypothetical protein
VSKKLQLKEQKGNDILQGWEEYLANRYDQLNNPALPGIRIAIVGKYTGLSDSYLSVVKSLQHSALKIEEKLVIEWVEASDLEPSTKDSAPAQYEHAWAVLLHILSAFLFPFVNNNNQGCEKKKKKKSAETQSCKWSSCAWRFWRARY